MKAFRPTKSRVISAYIVTGNCNTNDLKAERRGVSLKPDSYLYLMKTRNGISISILVLKVKLI